MTTAIQHRFKDIFEAELLAEIDKQAKFIALKTGEHIIEAGQMIRFVPIVLSGLIKVSREDESGKELLLYFIDANQSCAMTFTCCMQQYPSEITAVAEKDTELLAIPIGLMDEWMSKYPTWKSFVMRTIRSRFQELLVTLDQMAFQKLDDRLIHYLNERSKVTGSKLINLSHEQIATELATSRVVISRLLKKLENDGKILLYRNQIKILHEL